MRVYIDSHYKCHVSDDGTMRQLDLAFFDGKCDAFIEGYRCVPAGETWVREDGVAFTGEMLAPWQDYALLYTAQLEYELSLALAEKADMSAALEMLGVSDDEQVA